MLMRKALSYGFGLIAVFGVASVASAACAYNEIDRAVQVQIGDSWVAKISPGQSKCDEGHGGLVNVWDNPGGEAQSHSGAPGAQTQVDKDGSIKVVKETLSNYVMVYGADGKKQDEKEIGSVKAVE